MAFHMTYSTYKLNTKGDMYSVDVLLFQFGFCFPSFAALVAQLVKNPPIMQETWV